MLTDILTGKARKIIYAVYAVAGLVLGATQVGVLSVGGPQPVWLTVALAVFAYVGTAIGATAGANVPGTDKPYTQPH